MRCKPFTLGIVGLFIAALAADAGGLKDSPQAKPTIKQPGAEVDRADEAILRRAKLPTDADGLVKFLNARILPESERPKIAGLVNTLGVGHYRTRELALRALVKRGPAVLEVVRSQIPLPAVWQADTEKRYSTELIRRAEQAIQSIREQEPEPAVIAAAVRVAAAREAPGLVEAMIGYLPFAEQDGLVEELRIALTRLGVKDGKADPQLRAALADRAPVRRAIAAEVLTRIAYADHKAALHKTLADPDPVVRFRLARALAMTRHREAIPVLINSIPDLPVNVAWQAEDFLFKLAGKIAPPPVAMGNAPEARGKCRDAWLSWWNKQKENADLTNLKDPPRLLGRTLIVLLDQNTVLELGPDNVPRWEVKNLVFPLDAQLIGDDHVLVAEYRANRVSERNARGETVWQKGVVGPLVAQRLDNGNTFVVNDHQFLEFDKNGIEVFNVTFPGVDRKIMKAMKLPNGEIIAMLADARVVRFDARGNEIHAFQINLGLRLFGGRIHMLPNGRVLIPHSAENKVVEYDARGKIVWEVPFDQPVIATRLPNGNTLITSMEPGVGAVEVDRAGIHVWSYQHASNTRVTRALRR
ncbi:MAG: PQQ-binding-like beta-propeller repeat protein [Planctomycetes bacterium]|nr:PQQ-binding-like beta-propeller repeat protein [Planctomycetota bacterium]